MNLVALVKNCRSDFFIDWGDTVRIRDHYTPYADIAIVPSERDRDNGCELEEIRVFGESMSADVYDNFDEEQHKIVYEPNSILLIDGPLYQRATEGVGKTELHYGCGFKPRMTLRGEGEISGNEMNRVTSAAVNYSNVKMTSERCTYPYVQKILKDLEKEGIDSVIEKYFTI